MRVKEVYSYRNLKHDWIQPLVEAIEEIPEDIFFERDGTPLKREVKELDEQLFKRLIIKLGSKVKQNYRPMSPDNQFEVDILLQTKPKVIVEIEKGKLPRLELDIMKIINTIWQFPLEYSFGCIIVPASEYIKLKLAGERTPYQYLTNNLIPLNKSILNTKNQIGSFLLKDLVVVGYIDPRG